MARMMTVTQSTRLSLYSAVAASSLIASGACAQDLDLAIRPDVKSEAIVDWHVTTRIAPLPEQGLPAYSIPLSVGPLQRIADRIINVSARDDAGDLPLTSADKNGIMGPSRVYQGRRPQSGTVVLTYDVLPSLETISGPNFELRTEGLGSSAQGSALLLLPDTEGRYKVSINWDLSALPKGSSAIDSFSRSPEIEAQPIARLRKTYFMAGPLVTFPSSGIKSSAFRGASMALNNYDQEKLLAWSADAFKRMSTYFEFAEEPPFTVMMRSNTYGGVSGTAGPEGLIATMSRSQSERAVKSLIAHEMTHVYLNGLMDTDDTGDNLDLSWFTEGIAVFFQAEAPYTTGLFSGDEYLEDVNEEARAYYSNVRIHVPLAEAAKNFWTDPRQRLQIYDRGAMYFRVLEGEIRTKSNGKRGVVDLARAFLKRKAEGKSVGAKDWADLLDAELGPNARSEFEAMMNGALQLPASAALGPCFERVQEQMPSFDFGFDMSSLIKRPRIITGLDPQSPAAKAGLKNGDVVTNTLIIDALQPYPTRPITLKVDRGGQLLDITFAPSGALATGYQWRKRTGGCAAS